MNEHSQPGRDAEALQALTAVYGELPVPTSLYCRHVTATLQHANLARIADLLSPIVTRFAKDACEHAAPNPEAAKDDEEDDLLEGRFVIDRVRYYTLAMAPGGLRSELAKAVWEDEEVWRGGREAVSWEDVALLFEQPVIDLTFSAVGRGYHLAQGESSETPRPQAGPTNYLDFVAPFTDALETAAEEEGLVLTDEGVPRLPPRWFDYEDPRADEPWGVPPDHWAVEVTKREIQAFFERIPMDGTKVACREAAGYLSVERAADILHELCRRQIVQTDEKTAFVWRSIAGRPPEWWQQ